MLVPFVNKQQHSPEENYLNNLDTEMSSILNNKNYPHLIN
jgi:hypothetical protein